jgi:predicted lipoprotein with Yx(FWY)xxD motif
MKRALRVAAVFTALLISLAACGGDEADSDEISPSASAAKEETAAGAAATSEERSSRPSRKRGSTVEVMRTRFGRILVDGDGRALYLFTRDRGRERSRCYGSCAEAWPPFYTRGEPRAGGHARASRIGTTRRRNGKTQVTYNGHPLYYYVTDRKPGQVTCQNVEEFGGVWLVVSPKGRAIR